MLQALKVFVAKRDMGLLKKERKKKNGHKRCPKY